MESSTQTAVPEKLVLTSLAQLKNHTKALNRELAHCNIEIPHASLLHVVAKSFDFENYHAAEAILGKPVKPPRRSPKKKTSSDTEEFDLLMTAIREEVGEAQFNYAMRMNPLRRGSMSNPLAALDKLGYYSFKQQAQLAVQIFADMDVEYLDMSSIFNLETIAFSPNTIESMDYFEIKSTGPKTVESFYVEAIVGGKKVYYSPEPKHPIQIITDGQIRSLKNVVFCAWPSRNESRKQYIMPFDQYYDFMAGNYIPDGAHWTKRYRHDENGKRIYEGQSQYLNEKLEELQGLRDRMQQKGMPTEEEVEAIKMNAFAKVKREFMLSGLTGNAASSMAKWCVYTLGYDYAPINRATTWFLSAEEEDAWRKNVHKENANSILPTAIYAGAIYEALQDPKTNTTLNMEQIADDWRKFALTEGGRKEIESVLTWQKELLCLMNENIALILNMSHDDALQLVNDSCIYRLDEMEYKELLKG